MKMGHRLTMAQNEYQHDQEIILKTRIDQLQGVIEIIDEIGNESIAVRALELIAENVYCLDDTTYCNLAEDALNQLRRQK